MKESMQDPMSNSQMGRRSPMSNAERQRRWREKHRPRKRHVQMGPDGTAWTPNQFTSAMPMRPAVPTPTPVAAVPAPEHNYCPHCGAAIRKRAKAPKLAA